VLSLARVDDVGLLPAWLERDLDGPDVWSELRKVVADSAVDELVARAVLLGLPCSRVGEVDDARPAIAERVAEARPRTIDGAIVVDLAALWAGPLAGDVLSRLGARLITVESIRRPDGGRRARRFFEALHGRSESVALDLTDADGCATLRRLLARADVVIEGSRPRALEQMGIDVRSVLAGERGPRVWLSITAHGRGEGGRERVGFGDDAAAAGGLVGSVDATPRFVADAVADPLTGLTAAVAAAQLLERGGRWLVDVALARTARAASGGWLHAGDHGDAERPRPRRDPGRPMPLGRDTDAVLRSLGVT
jgi:crotonobetainyl-CoA:carnitine CoA-transferase CaiB-like acyl-CoA transferase